MRRIMTIGKMAGALALTLTLIAGLLSCQFLQGNAAAEKGRVVVSFSQVGPGSRSIVPDLVASVDSYTVTLTSLNGYVPKSLTVPSIQPSCDFTEVEAGTWDIAVEAKKGGAIIGSGVLTGELLNPGATLSRTVMLTPALSGGTGDLSFTVNLPAGSGIDYADFSLRDAANDTYMVDYKTPTFSTATTVTYAVTGLTAVSYELVLTLRCGGASGRVAGVFRESVNIWNGLVSDRWVASDGTLSTARTFAATELLDGNVQLSNLSVQLDEGTNAVLAFSSSQSVQDAGFIARGSGIRFIPTSSVDSQTLSYTWNGGPSRAIVSGVQSDSLSLQDGNNAIVVTVIAPDRVTTGSYTITLRWQASFTGSSNVEMVKVEGGTYLYNGLDVTVGSFLIGKYEVTQAQYLAITGANPSWHYQDSTSCPVETVSWYDAVGFCNKLSQAEGLDPVYTIMNSTIPWNGIFPVPTAGPITADFTKNGYRLPTEAEWVFAGKGGNLYNGYSYAGSNDINAVAWYQLNCSFTQPVGQKASNELGLYDMSGNVWEWCWDRAGSLPSGVNPSGPTSGTYAVVIGGSVNSSSSGPTNPIIESRDTSKVAADAIDDIGFRVARGAKHTFNFENLTIGNLNGQDGWTTTSWSTALDMQVGPDSLTPAPPNTTKVLWNDQAGAGVGIDASHRLNLDSTFHLGQPGYTYRYSFDFIKSCWGTKVALAADLNGDGKVTRDDSSEIVLALEVHHYSSTNNEFTLTLPDGSELITPATTFPDAGDLTCAWIRAELVFTGNRLTVRARSLTDSSWTSLWSDIPMGIDLAATGKTNPALWNMAFVHIETDAGKVDNIDFVELDAPDDTTIQILPVLAISPTGIDAQCDLGGSRIFSAPFGYDEYNWYLNGVLQSGESSRTITVQGSSNDLWLGKNRIMLVAKKESRYYSDEIEFEVYEAY
ncbi:MAG: hypothetical protein A2413_08745 [Treponema sp. RIFOXYC1_FULL_61_9]|nr:MAG: hypothetical protein A2001_07325 [Treponema sp. GWC1_61_84]OHE69379.1 MAG: hypothetical protein A2413_08745 [Treponema sp. RIFOXYC1_FULL_61_9]